MSAKIPWKVFFDLQCPYSKKCWERLPAIKERFGSQYDFAPISLTSLLFHPQAFTAQCAATYIRESKGQEAFLKYIDACFENQDKYMNAAIGDARKSEIDAVFVDIAEQAGLLDDKLSRKSLMEGIHDWDKAIRPAYTDHKVALGYGVVGTPKHVINEKLVPDTESEWGPAEWADVLEKL